MGKSYSNSSGTSQSSFAIGIKKFLLNAAAATVLRTITLPDASIDFSGGSIGDVLTKTGANAFGLSTPAGASTSQRFTLLDAVTVFDNIDGTRYQNATQSLTSVKMSMLNSGISGNTTIRINQFRSGSLFNSATASLAASSGNPAGASSSLSGTLSLAAGDVISVDVTVIAGGAPESLTVEF